MKKIAVSIFTIAMINMVACTKECEECKECDLGKDSTCNTDTIYLPPPPDTSCKTDLTKGLLAYYPFNGNFNDESGNGNNATAKNGAFLTTDMVGKASKAAGFDGINDYLIVPGNSKLNADTVTLSFQVMVKTINRRHVTVSKINFATGQSLSYGIHNSQPSDNKWNFGVTPGTDPCAKNDPYDPGMANYANQTMEANRWYNVIASFAGGSQKLYIDGVLQGTKTRTFANAKKCDNGDLMIGGWWSNDIVSIDGKIDEVRLYKRLLSDCEIKKLAEPFAD
ncbi:LamG domain-containing protein [Longitalea arenae]|uniref:LamG domain-containing protein n=1 Tax=Longitalea arenae TaxID=2812558 RepID=UPI001967F4EE|nr:LamG domain-containing protein [Longitalea arenae]